MARVRGLRRARLGGRRARRLSAALDDRGMWIDGEVRKEEALDDHAKGFLSGRRSGGLGELRWCWRSQRYCTPALR
jgi:hypothetical protein